MSENYEGLSSEELISLLKQRDIKIKEQTEEIQNIVSVLYVDNGFDCINIEKFEDIDLSDEDNLDIAKLESAVDKNESNYNSLTQDIFYYRKQLFSYSVNSWLRKYNNGNAPAFYEDSVGIIQRIDVDYESANFVYSELSQLIGKVPFNDLEQYLSLSTLLFTYKELHSKKGNSKNGILINPNEQESFEQFITFIFDEKEFKYGLKLYNNHEDKLSLLNSFYPKNDFILSYQSKKEKEALEEVIKSNSELTKNNIKRL